MKKYLPGIEVTLEIMGCIWKVLIMSYLIHTTIDAWELEKDDSGNNLEDAHIADNRA